MRQRLRYIFRFGEDRRKFVRQVGSVVLGVLIALGISEIAEEIRWNVRTNASERAIDAELALAAGVFDERVRVQPCLDRRLEDVRLLIAEARRTGRLPQIGTIGRPPTRPFSRAAWDVATGSGVTLHMDEARAAELANSYAQMSGFPDEVEEEQMLWASLRALENAPGPVSDDLLATAATTIGFLQFRSMLNGINARQQLDFIQARGIAPDYRLLSDRAFAADRPFSEREMVTGLRARPICGRLAVDRGTSPAG